MAPLQISTNDHAFVLQAAREEQRVDGRKLLDHRRVRLHFHPQAGMVEVQLGSTRILGVVSAITTAPHIDRPSEGLFSLDLVACPLADASFEPYRVSDQVRDARAVLQRAMVRSKVVDTEALCIKGGLVVWHVRLDLKILDHGGNLADCACIAGVLALHHFRNKEVTVVGEQVTIHEETERVPRPLTLHHMPLSVTYGLLALPDAASEAQKVVLIADPSRLEEAVLSGRIVITAGRREHSVVYGIQKYGGVAVQASVVTRCCVMAVERAAELDQVLQQALQHNEEQRRLALLRGREQTTLQTADEMVAKKTDEAGGNTQAVLDADSDDGDEEEKEEEEEDSDEEIAQTGKRTLQPG
eukprot:CAMPEP_0173078978 /NCGR_PEP_ID=MMETSP1102-20130122/14693_1 /TAXON_ID=49646 /ORGANISM="Geminigera sp., Strain Caron Lab Isolate" /LENGTH=355 /DNA_ID=CAMNT_0013950859 /DNA_START=45 /DNA_END=1109 /DNA_ORIENTATION=+